MIHAARASPSRGCTATCTKYHSVGSANAARYAEFRIRARKAPNRNRELFVERFMKARLRSVTLSAQTAGGNSAEALVAGPFDLQGRMAPRPLLCSARLVRAARPRGARDLPAGGGA